MYTKNELSRSRHSEIRAQRGQTDTYKYTQTDTETDETGEHTTIAALADDNNWNSRLTN